MFALHRPRRGLAGRRGRLARDRATRWPRYLRSLGGEIETGAGRAAGRPAAGARRSCSTPAPAQLAEIAEPALPRRYVARLRRYRYGPGAFKLDWALDGPIPWRDPRCLEAVDRAPRRHARGDRGRRGRGLARRAPRAPVRARCPAEPVRSQPRAGGQAHRLRLLPRAAGLDGRPDRAHRAPDRALRAWLPRPHPRPARRRRRRTSSATTRTTSAAPSPAASPTCASSSPGPVARLDPYSTPNPRIFICSASTPPGGGVHGMCGYHAARSALKQLERHEAAPLAA